MKAVILAAGKGVRLLPLTENMPKAMVLLHGKPLLEHLLLSLKEAEIKHVVIVVGYLKEKIIGYFGNSFDGMRIEYVEQKQQLGTGHAILQAQGAMKEDFLAGYADTIPVPGIWRQLEKATGFDAVVAVRSVESPERFGVVEVKGKNVVSLEEKPLQPKSNLVLAGFYRFSPKVFGAIKKIKPSERGELEITGAINVLAQKGKVGFVECKGKIIDIASLEDLKQAEEEQ